MLAFGRHFGNFLVYNDSHGERTPLTCAISEDGDKTYPHRRDIVSGKGDFAYPTAVETSDREAGLPSSSDAATSTM